MSYELKDYLNSINFTKDYLMDGGDPQWEKKYPAFVVNKCLSGHIDTVMFANEMNLNHQLTSRLQYDFLIFKRFSINSMGKFIYIKIKAKNLFQKILFLNVIF